MNQIDYLHVYKYFVGAKYLISIYLKYINFFFTLIIFESNRNEKKISYFFSHPFAHSKGIKILIIAVRFKSIKKLRSGN